MRRVLLVEDDRWSRESLTHLLRREGFAVRAFVSAEDAEAHDTEEPDIALLDLRLPGKRGDEFAESLLRKYPGVRVIFISGELSVALLERFGEGTQFFRKPVDLMSLMAAMGA